MLLLVLMYISIPQMGFPRDLIPRDEISWVG